MEDIEASIEVLKGTIKENQRQIKSCRKRIEKLQEAIKNRESYSELASELADLGTYWSIQINARTIEFEWDNGQFDYEALSIGNVFKSEKEAELAVEGLKELAYIKRSTDKDDLVQVARSESVSKAVLKLWGITNGSGGLE